MAADDRHHDTRHIGPSTCGVRRVPIGSWRRAMAADDRHHDTRHIGPSMRGMRRAPTGSWRRAMGRRRQAPCRVTPPDTRCTTPGISRDDSHLPLCRHPPSPSRHHVLAPHALRARPPHRTGHCPSPSSSGYVPAYPILPYGVTETSPLRGSEWHRTTKTDKTEMVRDVGLPRCDCPTTPSHPSFCIVGSFTKAVPITSPAGGRSFR